MKTTEGITSSHGFSIQATICGCSGLILYGLSYKGWILWLMLVFYVVYSLFAWFTFWLSKK